MSETSPKKKNKWQAHHWLTIKKRQIKTVMKLHYIAIRMAKMKKSDKILSADKDVEQLEISFICWKKEK